MLYELSFKSFLCWLLEETGATCLEHRPCAGVNCSCLAAVLLGRADQVFSLPEGRCAFYSTWSARPHRVHIEKTPHQSNAAAPRLEEEQKGRVCPRQGLQPPYRRVGKLLLLE